MPPADPSSNAEDAARPGAAPETSSIRKQVAQKQSDVSQTEREVEKISGEGSIISHDAFYMAKPFFTVTKGLFVVLIGSTVILAAFMFITEVGLLKRPDITLVDRMRDLIGWIVIPLLTFIIGYGFGSAIPRTK